MLEEVFDQLLRTANPALVTLVDFGIGLGGVALAVSRLNLLSRGVEMPRHLSALPTESAATVRARGFIAASFVCRQKNKYELNMGRSAHIEISFI